MSLCNTYRTITYTHRLPEHETSVSKHVDDIKKIKFRKSTIRWFFSGFAARRGLFPPRQTRFLDHTQRRATVGRIPSGE
jgi:hypothetical protein